MKLKYLLTTGLGFALLCTTASAANILLNSGFDTSTSSWSIAGSNQEWTNNKIPDLHQNFDTDGGNGYFWYTANAAAGNTGTQTITVGSSADFTLTSQFEQRNDAGAPASHNNATFTLELLDVANANAVLAPDSSTGTNPPAADTNVATFTRTYSSLAAGDYTVRWVIASGQGAVDNVELDFTAVPEPASTALLGLGGLALLLRRRKG